MSTWDARTHTTSKPSGEDTNFTLSSYGYFIPAGVKCIKGKRLALPFTKSAFYSASGANLYTMNRIGIRGSINANESCLEKYPESVYGKPFHKASVAEVILAMSVVASGSNGAGSQIGFGINTGRLNEIYTTTSQGKYHLVIDTRLLSNGIINGNENDAYYSGFLKYNIAASDGTVIIDSSAAYYNSGSANNNINVGKAPAINFVVSNTNTNGRGICVTYE